MKKFAKLLGFDPVEKQTSVKTEIIAGIVTFLAMAYILTVNPNQILWGGAFVNGEATFTPTDHVLWPSIFTSNYCGYRCAPARITNSGSPVEVVYLFYFTYDNLQRFDSLLSSAVISSIFVTYQLHLRSLLIKKACIHKIYRLGWRCTCFAQPLVT